jgi:hypothetical protein
MTDRILVIANNPSVEVRVIRVLNELRLNSHFCIIGVDDKRPVDGVLKAFDGRGKLINIKLEQFAVALVDGALFGDVHVWELIPVLKAHGIDCVGISNTFHELLQRSGAIVSEEKLQVYAFLRKELVGIHAAACERRRARCAS